jgi:transcriptional regulator with XRE-family HTH domain
MAYSFFASNIQHLKSIKAVKDEDLCQYLGITEQFFNQIERGEVLPSLAVEEKLANFFAVSPYELLSKDLTKSEQMRSAFRATHIGVEDFENIAFFNKVLINYIRMDKIRANAQKRK